MGAPDTSSSPEEEEDEVFFENGFGADDLDHTKAVIGGEEDEPLRETLDYDESGTKIRESDYDYPPSQRLPKVLHLANDDLPPLEEPVLSFIKEMVLEALPPITLGLLGLIFVGVLLERVQSWSAFRRIAELNVLFPILSNLKGNLETNLSSRFSTSANIGELDHRRTRRALVIGNLALVQVQALLVSAVAGLIAFWLGLLGHTVKGKLSGWHESMMMISTAMVTASLSAAAVANFMCCLVVVSRRYGINPDNIATPVAGALSDLIVLLALSLIATLFVSVANTILTTLVLLTLLITIPFIIFSIYKNSYVKELLWAGWGPLFMAMAISSMAGFAFGSFVDQYDGLALIAPVMSGLVGSLGSVSASRISTALHAGAEEQYSRVQIALFAIHLPIQILFLCFLWGTSQLTFGIAFVIAYLIASCISVIVSLVAAKFLTLWLWNKDYDPDAYCIPILSSCMDVICQTLLIFSFFMVTKVIGSGVKDTP